MYGNRRITGTGDEALVYAATQRANRGKCVVSIFTHLCSTEKSIEQLTMVESG
jgi:hypothetical protein